MSERIVDRLEIIHIEIGKCDGLGLAGSDFEERLCIRSEDTPILHPCEFIEMGVYGFLE